MIKVEVIEKFTLKKFNELEKIKRANKEHEDPKYDGTLFANDEFECSEEMAKYLTGKNPIKKIVVKVIEIEPKKEDHVVDEIKYDVEKPVELKETIKPKKKKSSKK